jgi:hypothetical protein
MKIEAYMNVDPQGGAIFFRTNVYHVATIPLVSAYELQAAQAREAKLREALAGLREHSLCPDTMVRLLAIPTDDSALQERLAQERERVIQCIKYCRSNRMTNKQTEDAIRGLA